MVINVCVVWFLMSSTWESAVKEGKAESERRSREVFVQEGASEDLKLARDERNEFKNLTVTTRGGYKMYGVPVITSEGEKLYFIFPNDAPKFFELAQNHDGHVIVRRVSGKMEYS